MLNDTEEKLLRLALDEGAQPGEIDNAAAMLIRKLRKRHVSADELIYILKPENDSAGHELQIMPFGKYEGIALMYIPHDYLEWVLQNCRNISLHLRRAIYECLSEPD